MAARTLIRALDPFVPLIVNNGNRYCTIARYGSLRHHALVSRTRRAQRIETAFKREFEKVEKAMAQPALAGGIPLTDLLKRVNRLALQYLPEQDPPDSRISRVFTPRSFRHYQTLGCIDPPKRDGKQAVYGVRHFTQALLVRKLLSERVPAEKMTGLMTGRSTEETKRLLFGGIEMVARAIDGGEGSASVSEVPESWKRVVVRPGIELHLREDLPSPRPEELKELLAALETTLRQCLR